MEKQLIQENFDEILEKIKFSLREEYLAWSSDVDELLADAQDWDETDFEENALVDEAMIDLQARERLDSMTEEELLALLED